MEETLVEPTEDGAASRLLKPLAKGTTGLYSGYLLATYCPPKTPAGELHTGKGGGQQIGGHDGIGLGISVAVGSPIR